MKRKLALLAAVLMLVTLFAGCGGGTTTTPTNAPAPTKAPAPTAAPAPGGDTPTAAPAPDDGPYQFAAGKYTVDERGVPLEKYAYSLPLTTSDEVFTYWTGSLVPDQIDPDHYEDGPYPSLLRELTGVNIEYHAIASASRKENFAALLASDDLFDLMISFKAYYPGTMWNAMEDGYSVNLYDYKDYFPNYMYMLYAHEDDVDYRARLMMDKTTICSFYSLYDQRLPSYGAATRGDWLDKLGMTPDDVVTMDDFHDLCVAYQSQLGVEHPLVLFQMLDPHRYMSAFDTIASTNPSGIGVIAPLFVKDGKVQVADTTEGDRNYMTTINKWYNEGIIIPNWSTFDGNNNFMPDFYDDKLGITSMLPGEAGGYVDNERTPEAYWIALHEPVLYKGQVFHLGDSASWIQGYGSWTITTKCENIPMLCTYADWFYSDEGYELSNWGREGTADGCVFFYNDKGERELNDFILNNPAGYSWALQEYAYSPMFEAGILLCYRHYAFPGGEKLWAFYDIWTNPDYYVYDGSMVFPSSLSVPDEDQKYLNTVGTDLNTFVAENYVQFVDGSRPLSDWDNYVNSVKSLSGWNECMEIWQRNYDEYMAKLTA